MRSRTTAAAVLLLLSCLLVSCRGSGSSGGVVTDEDGLRARIDALFTAEQTEDRRSWYALTAQSRLGDMSFEDFVEATGGGRERKFSLVSWTVLSIHPIELKEEQEAFAEMAVKVPMDVVIEGPDGVTKKVPDHTDYWFRMDGKWFWGWRGFPSD